MVRSEELEFADSESDILMEDKNGKMKAVQRYRDVIMKWSDHTELMVFACENQSFVHYGMPIRMMLYDSLSYMEQMRELWGNRKPVGETYPEKIQKKYGDVLQKYISNYRMNLIDLGKVQHLERFHSDLQYIFGMLQYRGDKHALQQYVWEHKDYFRKLDMDTFHVVQEFTHSKTLFQKVVLERTGKE